jgi:CheY-like chemotaxis protein
MINKVLFADQDPVLVETAKTRLTAAGYETHVAQDGRQAYDMAVKFTPDLIVISALMPVVNGFEFCKAVKASEQTRDIPIIILVDKPSMEDSFMFLGIKNFVRKPFQFDALEAMVKDKLGLAMAMHTNKTKVLFHCTTHAAMNSAKKLIEHVQQWSSVFVGQGRDVLATAPVFVPEIIVLDLFVEDIPVNELIEQLRKMPDLANAQIFTYYTPLSSAQNSLALQAKMIEVQYFKGVSAQAGATEYLGPFNEDNFMDLLNPYRKDFQA